MITKEELGSEEKLIRDAQFKTIFRVYLCLLKLRTAGVRDVQRIMGFATPSQARYHLKRLGSLGLVTENESGDFLVVHRRFGILRFYFKTGRWVVPLSLFYAIFFASFTALLYARAGAFELLLLGGMITLKEIVDSYSFFRVL